MTPEQLAISFLFVFLYGGLVGRALTLAQSARKITEATTALLNSEWLSPSAKAAELIHPDQDAIEIPEFIPSLTLQCRLIHSSVKARAV